MYRRSVSLAVLLSFVSYVVGCSSIRYVSTDEMSQVGEESSVWVTTTDGTQYEIKEPKVEGSKIVGYVDREGLKEIDLSEIESLGVKEPDQRKTLLLGVIGLTGVAMLIWVLTDESGESEPCGT